MPTHADDDDPDLNNSTSTNAALLPATSSPGGNNGFLWNSNNSSSLLRTATTDTTTTLNDEDDDDDVDGAPSTTGIMATTAAVGGGSRTDLVLTELGGCGTGNPTPPRVELRGVGGTSSTMQVGGQHKKPASGFSSIWRKYRCQMLMLIAFIEFGLLVVIVGVTLYLAGLTATCDHSSSSSGSGSGRQAGDSPAHSTTGNICLTDECVRTAASLLSAMNTQADPCVNFFDYACGTWNKKHVIPEDRSSISTFEVLADQQQFILKSLLEEPVSPQDHEATVKAKRFYSSCMNIAQIRADGDEHLIQVLASLGGWPVIERDWKAPTFSKEELFGRLRGEFSESVIIELFVGADDKNSSAHIIQLDQLVLALPSQDYYLKASSEGDLQAYHKYMVSIAMLLGANATTAERELQDVVKFEMQLANASLPEADRHDTSAIYKKLTLRQLQREVPQINWVEYVQAAVGPDIEITAAEEVVCYALPYLVQMGRILEETDDRVVHNYVVWRLVMSIMTHMIDEFQSKRVEFRKILLGIQSERNRWSQCVEWTNKKMGMAVGAMFIRENFKRDSKETALEMIHTIRAAFNELLAENDWMDDETRAVAKEKANAMNERIGYPEFLTNPKELEKEYVNLTLTENHFVHNILYILKWDAQRNLQLLRKPVDKERWATEPAVVNAFYSPNKNDIVFPAGILQPHFYSSNFPKSLNYGGIGVVIGHEITHGFDDKGRQFDKDGNMIQWWNNSTIRRFRERAQCIVDQYSRYKIEEVGLYLNGRMTQGENIADNGGLKQSFRAYKKWVRLHGEEPELPGLNLNHDQLFFLNYAQIWCGKMRPEDAITKIRSSVHSPGIIRVIGPLSNSKDFAKAYRCPLGSPMNPHNKCSVW